MSGGGFSLPIGCDGSTVDSWAQEGYEHPVGLEKVRAGESKFVAGCDLAKWLAVCLLLGVLGWHAITMLMAALQAKPATLNAFVKCLAEWRIMDVVLALVALLTSGGWFIECKRNKGLVFKAGVRRHAREASDPVNSRSGLDEVGATPKRKKK